METLLVDGIALIARMQKSNQVWLRVLLPDLSAMSVCIDESSIANRQYSLFYQANVVLRACAKTIFEHDAEWFFASIPIKDRAKMLFAMIDKLQECDK